MQCSTRLFQLLLAATLLGAPIALAQNTPAIDPKADEILRKMSMSLADAKSFTFESHDTTDQIAPNGQKIQVGKHAKIAVRRPDAVAAVIDGDEEQMQFASSDGKVYIVNNLTKCYAMTDVPKSIDEMFDFLAQKYGMTAPLCDLVFSDPYKVLTERVRSGQYLGKRKVMGTPCHHLAFRQDGIDWQIWIEDSERAVPRKVVITHKELPGYPQFTALLSEWNLDAKLPDSAFAASPPPDYKKIDLAPVAEESKDR